MGQFVLGVRSKLFGGPSLQPYCPLAHSVLSLPLPPWISSVEGGPSFSLSSSPLPVSPCKPLLPLSVREACGSSSPLLFWVLLGRAGPTGIGPPLPHKFSSMIKSQHGSALPSTVSSPHPRRSPDHQNCCRSAVLRWRTFEDTLFGGILNEWGSPLDDHSVHVREWPMHGRYPNATGSCHDSGKSGIRLEFPNSTKR